MEVSDFAGCLDWTGTVTFESPTGFDSKGTADTWSNSTEAPTGWAFTNIRTAGLSEGLALGSESGFENHLTLDLLQLEDDIDASAGYARPVINDSAGRGVVTAGGANPMMVQVFSNGGNAPGDVSVTVREGGPAGTVIHNETVDLDEYENVQVGFSYTPDDEGPYTLFTTVSTPGDDVPNDSQATTGWAGPVEPLGAGRGRRGLHGRRGCPRGCAGGARHPVRRGDDSRLRRDDGGV